MPAFHDHLPDAPGWRTRSSESLYSSPHLSVSRVVRETPARPDGVAWTVAHRKAAVVIVPQTAEDRFLLIEQERVAVGALLWEFPAGQIDSRDASRSETALRELSEETGYGLAPGCTLREMGSFFPSAGFLDEISFLYLANHVEPLRERYDPDASEAITACRPFTAGEIKAMIARGDIRDANTLAAWARMHALDLLPTCP